MSTPLCENRTPLQNALSAKRPEEREDSRTHESCLLLPDQQETPRAHAQSLPRRDQGSKTLQTHWQCWHGDCKSCPAHRNTANETEKHMSSSFRIIVHHALMTANALADKASTEAVQQDFVERMAKICQRWDVNADELKNIFCPFSRASEK
jgi:hypothetical protein